MSWGGADGSSWLGGYARWRGIVLGLAVLVGLGFMVRSGGGPLTTLLAQDAEKKTVEDAPEDAPKKTKSKKDAPKRKAKTSWEWFKAGGLIGYTICLLSVVAAGFVIEHFLTIRKFRMMPPQVLADLEQMIEQNELDQAIEYCHQPNNQSLASDVILAGLERYRGSEFGFAEYKSAVEEAGEDHTARLYRKTEVLGVIGAIAPMLGLLGTVQGMMLAFDAIATTSGAEKEGALAENIALALVTTLEGLFVAIPSMVFFSFFRNKIDSLVAETGKRVEQVLTPLGRKR